MITYKVYKKDFKLFLEYNNYDEKLKHFYDYYKDTDIFILLSSHMENWSYCNETDYNSGKSCKTCHVKCKIIDFKKLLRNEKLKRLI